MRPGRTQQQSGFSYVEVLVGILMLAIIAGGIAQGLAQSSGGLGRARVDSVAHELAASQLDQAHRMDYSELGTVGGNPPGTIAASQTKVVQSVSYTVATEVRYVDDQALGQLRNYVNYKKVTVRVTPQVTGAKVTTASTIIAPPAIGAIAGKASVFATVVDSLTGEPIPGVSVTVDQGVSPARTDTTDSQGRVVFAGLEPNPEDPSDPQYRYRLTLAKGGYVTARDSTPDLAQQHLAATQTWTTTLKMFRPMTVAANLRNAQTGALVADTAEVTLTSPAPNSATQTASGATGVFTFSQIAGNDIEPSHTAYTLAADADCYVAATVNEDISVGYPGLTTYAFNVDLQPRPRSYLDIQVVNNTTGTPITTAQVQVSGGEAQIDPKPRTVNASGIAHYCVEPSGSVSYVVSAGASGYSVASVTLVTTLEQTTPFTIRLVPASSTGTIRLNAGASGRLVRLVNRPPNAVPYDASQITNASGYASFPTLPAGSYTAYIASGFNSDGSPVWSAGKAVTCVAGSTRTYTVP